MFSYECLALIWKFWRTLRRYYWSIIFFISTPILLCGLLVYIKTLESSGNKLEPETRFDPTTHKALIQNFIYFNYTWEILYTPADNVTGRIMEGFRTLFPSYQINTLRGVLDEETMENWFADKFKRGAFSTEGNKKSLGYGVIFHTADRRNLNYTLRNILSDVWQTDLIFPSFSVPGPTSLSSRYFYEGFAALQASINTGYMDYLGMKNMHNWSIEEFPYPPYYKEVAFQLINSTLLPLVFIFGYVFMFKSMADRIVNEKRNGVREMLKLQGLSLHMIYISWFFRYFLLSLISVTIIVVLLKSNFGKNPILPNSSPIILLVFFMAYCCNSIFLMFAVSSVFVYSRYAGNVVLFLWLISYFFSINHYSNVLLPVGAMRKGIEIICSLESSNVGAKFNNLTYKTPKSKEIPLLFIILTMLISSIVYTVISIYVDSIFRGEFRRAWHLVIPNFLKSKPKKMKASEELRFNKAVIENADLPIGIKVVNICKVYSNLIAVDGLSIDIYENTITVLLGHNGAGKTTLMSMMTGVLSPTSGEIYIDGKDIFLDRQGYKRDLGYCPQHDMLLSDLTVYEHLIFFGLIKGISKLKLHVKSSFILEKLDITHRKDELVSNLSGGMKRKLCLAIALINNPKVLFLDEPTSGLDPQSRRNIWDILKSLREGRTILITTHFMDEAEVLGDRVAIMSYGQLRCYGTSVFLKKHYGSGYHVVIRYLADDKSNQSIQYLVNHCIHGAHIIEDAALKEIKVEIPENQVLHMSTLFEKLEKAVDMKNVVIEVSHTSMEDVFVSIQQLEGVSLGIDESENLRLFKREPVKSTSLVCLQIQALITKRLIWLKGNLGMFICMLIVLPALTAFLTIYNSVLIIESLDSVALLLELKSYGETKVIIGGVEKDENVKNFVDRIESQGGVVSLLNQRTQDRLLEEAARDEKSYRLSCVVAAEFLENPTIFYSSIAIHSLGIAINLIFNYIINMDNGERETVNITTYNYPLTLNSKKCSQYSLETLTVIMFWWYMFCLGCFMSFLYFCIFPINEQNSKIKHLQYMTGLRSLTYWFANFIVDILFLLMSLLVILVLILLTDQIFMFANAKILASLFLAIFLFGVSTILLSYVISFIFNSSNIAMSVTLFISILMAIIGNFLIKFWTDKEYQYFFYLCPLVPFIIIVLGITKEAPVWFQCRICKIGSIVPVCDALSETTPSNLMTLFSTEFIFLAADAFIFFALTLILDLGLIQFLYWQIKKTIYGPIDFTPSYLDTDVMEEKGDTLMFKQTFYGEEITEIPILVVDGLARKYSKTFTSVYDVSFTINKGDCFGLLGVNGSGKTTTFAMMTALIRPTMGNSTINTLTQRYSLLDSKYEYLKLIGYCPKENVLIEELSGKQMLNLISSLRGTRLEDLSYTTKKWINLLDLHPYSDKPCGNYSGGNKRKLCTALAFISDPLVVLLDKPTSAIDPVTRKKIWKVLEQCQLNDQTILFSSHNFDECEAVCNRLTIMIDGSMQCIGSVQHLKQKYAEGFILSAKIKIVSSEDQIEKLKVNIVGLFGPDCRLIDEHRGLLYFHIRNSHFRWSYLFKEMNKMKDNNEIIEDYVLSDTTLEKVFLTFAKQNKN